MQPSEGFAIVAIAVAAILVVALLVPSLRQRMMRRLTPLAGVAMALVVAGVVFGAERWLGYGLMGAGVALAVIDAVLRSRRG